jgi:hypothetical protein
MAENAQTNCCQTTIPGSNQENSCPTKNRRGRPRAAGRAIRLSLRIRGQSEEEDRLIDKIESLSPGQRSRYIRRRLLTGDAEQVLDQVIQETELVQSRLDMMWDDQEDL